MSAEYALLALDRALAVDRAILGLVATLGEELEELRDRVAALERTCQNDPPGGQGGSTLDPPGPAEGPVPAAVSPEKIPRETPGVFDDQGVHLAAAVEWESRGNFPKKISGEE